MSEDDKVFARIASRLDYQSNLACLQVEWEALVASHPESAVAQMQQGMAAIGALLQEHAASLYCQCQGQGQCNKCLALHALRTARLL